MTKVASRRVMYIAAGILIVLGLVALFGLIASIGLSNLLQADMTSQRNMLIVGFILFMGLSVPAYFSGVELTFEPDWLADVITTVGSTGMAVAAILGLILDNVIPGTPEECGFARISETHGPVGDTTGQIPAPSDN